MYHELLNFADIFDHFRIRSSVVSVDEESEDKYTSKQDVSTNMGCPAIVLNFKPKKVDRITLRGVKGNEFGYKGNRQDNAPIGSPASLSLDQGDDTNQAGRQAVL